MQLDTEIMNVFAISAFDEVYLPSINRKTFEQVNSASLFDYHFKEKFSKEDTLHIIIGLDSGLLANYVLSMPLAKGAIYLFVEIQEVLDLLTIDLADESDQVKVCNFDDFKQFMDETRSSVFVAKQQFCIHRSLGASSDHLPQYSCLATDVEKYVNDLFYQECIGFSQKSFFREQLRNVAENHTPVSILKNHFQNMTAIVIAGGPSLDDTINWIKSHQQKLVIFAVSRVAGKLLHEGIIPQIIVSVDPEDFSFEVNRGMLELAKTSLFVNSYHVSSRLLAQWQGMALYMGSRLAWSPKDKDNIQTMGPTVTNSAVHLAMQLGFKQVLLTGADFCFSPTGFTHAKGSLETSLGPNLGFIGEWVETYAGDIAETAVQLKMAAESLEDDVNSSPNVSVVNLSANACKIPGIPYKHYSEILLEQESISASELLYNLSKLRTKNLIQIDLDDVITSVNQTKEAFQVILSKTEDAISLAKTASDSDMNFLHASKEIEAIEQHINDHYPDLAQMIKFYGYFEFSKFLTTKQNEDWDKQHVVKMTLDYYTAFNEVASDLHQQICETTLRLLSRKAELQDVSLLSEIAKQWRNDNQPGRVFNWLELKNNQNVTEFDAATNHLINELKSEFQTQFEKKPDVYINVVKNQSTHQKILDKIIHLFQIKHLEGLRYLAKNLALINKNDSDLDYLFHLAKSHQLFLEKEYKEALATIDAFQGKPDELLLRLKLKLGLLSSKLDIAKEAVEQITQFSDQYLPYYAYILKLDGHYNAAINIYLDYLDKYPSDISTWIKLGVFMVDINQLEAAETVFINALNAIPDNPILHDYLVKVQEQIKTLQ